MSFASPLQLQWFSLVLLLPTALVIYLSGKAIYNVYLSPLSRFPGPKVAGATRLWYALQMISGNLPHSIRRLHELYGPIVRVAPDELSYNTSTAWNDIYGFRHGKAEMGKDTPFYTNESQPPSILSAGRDKHALFRRLMSRGFSEAALREQEPLIQGYLNLLVSRLRDVSKQGKPVEVVSWFNFFTFDVIGDLAFGEPFGCLQSSDYHPWIAMIFSAIRMLAIKQALGYYPILDKTLALFIPARLQAKAEAHSAMTREKTLRRKESRVDRADFVSNLMKEENKISDVDLFGNCGTLIVAGSETTATVLSAATFFILRHPEVGRKLVAEVRGAFEKVEEINFAKVNGLKYLLACLNETLRLFPPVPSGLARRVPVGGDHIDGKFVPEGTQVSVLQLSANTSPSNWSRSLEFIPERWTDDSRFAGDDRAAMQSFSTGPRNCIGRNLAYVEMRLVLARLLWEFDLELLQTEQDWADSKVYIIWEKKPLMIRMTPVNR